MKLLLVKSHYETILRSHFPKGTHFLYKIQPQVTLQRSYYI